MAGFEPLTLQQLGYFWQSIMNIRFFYSRLSNSERPMPRRGQRPLALALPPASAEARVRIPDLVGKLLLVAIDVAAEFSDGDAFDRAEILQRAGPQREARADPGCPIGPHAARVEQAAAGPPGRSPAAAVLAREDREAVEPVPGVEVRHQGGDGGLG